MKLVEILARELGEWPEGVDEIFQDYDRELRYIGWNTSTLTGKRPDDLADDHRRLGEGAPAGVTRDMWETERAKLVSKAEWNGEGLPPVHTVCEHQRHDDDCNSWFPVFILAHATVGDRHVAVFQRVDDDMHISFSDAVFFRPIRTPEQVATENREKGIMEMMRKSGERLSFRKICEALYDAGYRKQEKDQ